MTSIVFGSILIQLKDNIAGVGRISGDAGVGVSGYVVDESVVDALDVGHVHGGQHVADGGVVGAVDVPLDLGRVRDYFFHVLHRLVEEAG